LRVGILGGAFNPPHLGHLILAQEAFVGLGLDQVVWMPYGEPSHRALPDDPGPEARFSMCECAAGGDARFAVSRIEIDRPGPV
jgi:nicotinate-nucleotide adenylyltransferase